ncbi:DUF479 domain-containing protein [Mangrovimonas sp. CR14]|uniref:acyl carrier protein phosphodiesterase n=1 Tax=Mangrovimonas sp. CR14 TaxID=2706120 RepID=UPI0014236911|nr:ACP phosphodiesterase [Mangrovimonas sp. CR14]NIK93469.1 DUF479 domain-containing protein [Mangrovimonas sp. CR14]
MNFLAHIYLSGNNEMVTIGNFIADSIKGKQYLDYPKEVQIGILLHREIDTFTDAHPIVRQSSKRLHAKYSHYSGVIVDILYDHFLAKNWSDYSAVPLKQFTANFYQIMEENFDWLPANTQRMVPFMKAEDWLLNYAQIEGIQNVLNGMNRRTNYKSGMHQATNELRQFYYDFESEFTHFFTELINFSKTKLPEIESKIS